jgi:hypothetical protein
VGVDDFSVAYFDDFDNIKELLRNSARIEFAGEDAERSRSAVTIFSSELRAAKSTRAATAIS